VGRTLLSDKAPPQGGAFLCLHRNAHVGTAAPGCPPSEARLAGGPA